MTDYDAISIAEGYAHDDCTEAQYKAAWQYLIDTGLAWRLQGWFGRTASRMIKDGFCASPERNQSAHSFSPCIPDSLDDTRAESAGFCPPPKADNLCPH